MKKETKYMAISCTKKEETDWKRKKNRTHNPLLNGNRKLEKEKTQTNTYKKT